MAKKKVFVSFDYDNDRDYKNLLCAWDANPFIDFKIEDRTSNEIQSWDIPTVKSCLSRRINDSTYTIVIIGEEINKLHKDRYTIGHDNWQQFELAKSKENYNKVVFVKLYSWYNLPNNYYGSNYRIVNGFNKDKILDALNSF